MVVLPQNSGILRRLMGRWQKSHSPSEQKPQPSAPSLEERLDSLPEEQRRSAILGAVKQGIVNKPEYVAFALEEMQNDDNVGVYACATFAVQHAMHQKAVEIYTSNKLYGDAISILLDIGEVDKALELFPLLPESKGFFSKGKLYEKAAELALISLDTRIEDLQELALSSYHEDSKFEEEGKLAERWQQPKRAIAAYLAGAEKDLHNVLFWCRNAARVAKDSDDNAGAKNYLRRAADTLIEDPLFASLYAEDILRLGEEIDDPTIIQKAYELKQDYVNAGSIAKTRRGDLDGAIVNYLKGNRPDLAAKCALSEKMFGRAISIYKEAGKLEEALQTAMDNGLTAEAKETAKEIVSEWNDKLLGYRTLVRLSTPEEADRLSREAEFHFAKKGMFEEAMEFSHDDRNRFVYSLLAKNIEARETCR